MSIPNGKVAKCCQYLRYTELCQKKKTWNVKTTPYGFAKLDESCLSTFIVNRLADPFTRFYFEGYIQTVFVSDSSRTVYNLLANSVGPEEGSMTEYTHGIMSMYFEMVAKLGGVSIFFVVVLPLSDLYLKLHLS